jgi:hypothetical protein
MTRKIRSESQSQEDVHIQRFLDKITPSVITSDCQTVERYIHQNSVKAGLVKQVEECKWSSFCEKIYRINVPQSTRFMAYIWS